MHFKPSRNDAMTSNQAEATEARLNYIVYGYIRSRLVRNGYRNPLLTTMEIPPAMVGNLCISYFKTKDYFSSTNHSKFMSVNKDQNVVTWHKGHWGMGTAYASLDITRDLPFIYVWYIKFTFSDSHHNSYGVGIDSSNGKCKEIRFHPNYENKDYDHYGLCNAGVIHSSNIDMNDEDQWLINRGCTMNVGKLIKIELNIPIIHTMDILYIHSKLA